MKKHSIGFNAFVNGLSNILSLFFPLITFPYISRILSVQSIGIFNFSNTYIKLFYPDSCSWNSNLCSQRRSKISR